MRTHIVALALAGCFLGGCGADDKPMNRQEFCQERAKRECSNVAPACLMLEAECLTSREAACNNEAAVELADQRAFVAANAEACLGRVSDVFGKLERGAMAISANDWRSIDTACQRVFQGTALANQKCQQDADCEGTLICDRGYCGTSKVVSAGAGCANTGESCPQGSYCSAESGRPVCTVRLGFGGSCNAAIPCLENLRCDVVGLCVERLAAGATCSADTDCETGFCEPFAQKCALDVRFADGTAACTFFKTISPTRGATAADGGVD